MSKLTCQSSRVAFLLGIIESMKGVVKPGAPVKVAEVKYMVEQELVPRQYRKPCVVEGRVFDSVTEAAHYLSWYRQDLWANSKAAQRMDAYGVMNNLRMRIGRLCTEDATDGYYWI